MSDTGPRFGAVTNAHGIGKVESQLRDRGNEIENEVRLAVRGAALNDEQPKKSRRGGRRPGAGRPSLVAQMQRADAAAEAAVEKLRSDIDPEDALGRILVYHVDAFEQQIARGKHGSPQKANEAARNILHVGRELIQYRKPKLQAVAVQAEVDVRTVIRAPEVCKSTQEWIEKYGAKPVAELPTPYRAGNH